jgi:hypothetical protein
LDAAVRHVAGFARMIKDLSGDENTLTKWIGAVDADLRPHFECSYPGCAATWRPSSPG